MTAPRGSARSPSSTTFRRTATVTATEPSVLLKLGRETFLEAVTGHEPARLAAERVAASRT